jgi:hypothetical protein
MRHVSVSAGGDRMRVAVLTEPRRLPARPTSVMPERAGMDGTNLVDHADAIVAPARLSHDRRT